jgi:hypothetical protein
MAQEDAMSLRLTAVFFLVLGGCASQATLTVYTYPQGGYISQVDGVVFGTSPATVVYRPEDLKEHVDDRGCFVVRGVQSKWVSGATSQLSPVTLCGAPNGSYQITLTRSPDAPGLEQDLQFAMQLGNSLAQRAAQQQAAQAAQTNATLNAIRALNPSPPVGMASPGVGFLKRQYVSGMNRICIYDRLGSEVATTIGAAELCPLNF